MNADALKWIAEHAKDFDHAEELAEAMRWAYADSACLMRSLPGRFITNEACRDASKAILDRAALPADGRE